MKKQEELEKKAKELERRERELQSHSLGAGAGKKGNLGVVGRRALILICVAPELFRLLLCNPGDDMSHDLDQWITYTCE